MTERGLNAMQAMVPSHGQLANNVMHFCRLLRGVGLHIGPGRMLAALQAVELVGVERRADVYWTLHATLIDRHQDKDVFDQAFHIFWRNPDLLKRAMSILLPHQTVEETRDQGMSRRIAEALAQGRVPGPDPRPEQEAKPEIEWDARLTLSSREILRTMDFEQMSGKEITAAKRAIADMRLALPERRTRRFEPASSGARIDARRMFRASLRRSGEMIDLAWRRPRVRPLPVVVICDISGSMSRYSRMLLHFVHALSSTRDRVHSFVFGTRLTNITRHLRLRDVDDALARVGAAVEDWSGGTRIAECLHAFNRDWSRRVLSRGAAVLLITDGLEREEGARLAVEMERLHRRARRLIWLNPLLRFDGYQATAQGARAMIRHVDELRSAHNLDSLQELAEALSGLPDVAAARRAVMEHRRGGGEHG